MCIFEPNHQYYYKPYLEANKLEERQILKY